MNCVFFAFAIFNVIVEATAPKPRTRAVTQPTPHPGEHSPAFPADSSPEQSVVPARPVAEQPPGSFLDSRWDLHAQWLADSRTRFSANLAFSSTAFITMVIWLTVVLAWTCIPQLRWGPAAALAMQTFSVALTFVYAIAPFSYHNSLVIGLLCCLYFWFTIPHHNRYGKLLPSTIEANQWAAMAWLGLYILYVAIYAGVAVLSNATKRPSN